MTRTGASSLVCDRRYDLRSPEEYQGAIDTLREVGRRARVYLSMPVVEGVTPRALVDFPGGSETTDPSGLVRKDGIFQLDEIGLSPMDHVALYGDGIFEGILIRDGSIFLYEEHMDRMDRSLEKIHVELPIDRDLLTVAELAHEGYFFAAPWVTTVFGGTGYYFTGRWTTSRCTTCSCLCCSVSHIQLLV